MFPRFVVVTTKHIPATPTVLEKNEVLNYATADNKEQAEALAAEKVAEHRKAHIPASQFGPGTPQIQAAIFVQSK